MINFIKGVFSDDKGTPSSTRIIMFLLAAVSSFVLVRMSIHIVHLTDLGALAIWLSDLPLIIASLVAFFTAPYTVSNSVSSIADVLRSLRKD